MSKRDISSVKKLTPSDLCKDPCIAIIAEKPRAAHKIAQALGSFRRIMLNGIPIYTLSIDSKNIVIVPSAGHLFTLSTNDKGYPVYNYAWVPRHLAERGYEHLKKYHLVLPQILKKASLYVNACDYDIEGSVIGFMIIKSWGDISRAKRMKFSTLTREDILRSFYNLEPLDFNMVEAGLARHELDWIWGINISRALTDLYSRRGEKKVLSAGRVQTPTLYEALNKYIERETFVPEPLYRISLKGVYRERVIDFEELNEPFRTKLDAERFRIESLKKGFIEIVESSQKELRLRPPHPFNLGDLQLEAYDIYKISPSEALSVLEDLYLEGLISYPRTNSQKLSDKIDHREIIKNLSRISDYREFSEELLKKKTLKPNNGDKEDPAHPAIYPTGETPRKRLSDKHAKLYDLIVRRYLATFSDDAVIREVTLEGCVLQRCFRASGRVIVSEGWLRIYRFYSLREKEVPYVARGVSIPISEIKIVKSYTKPPKLYNRATLLKWMERENIGTESTRAEIIETLFRRKYVSGRELKVTSLGIEVVDLLEKYFPELLSTELTREFERQLNEILYGRKRREEVVKEAIEVIDRLIERFVNEVIYVKSYSEPREDNKCKICRFARDPSSELGFCKIHEKAYQNLIRSYETWRNDNYEWSEYLSKIKNSRLTGVFVKEVIKFLEGRE